MARSLSRLAIAVLLAASGHAAPAPSLDEQIAPYTKPQHLAHIENGRTINVVCLGHGSPTVVLNAGLEQWSFWWWVTQRAVAEQTRVCAWDRAGYNRR